jgi:hypothetical protein
MQFWTDRVVVAVTLDLYGDELSSNPGRDTGYPDTLSWFSSAPEGMYGDFLNWFQILVRESYS